MLLLVCCFCAICSTSSLYSFVSSCSFGTSKMNLFHIWRAKKRKCNHDGCGNASFLFANSRYDCFDTCILGFLFPVITAANAGAMVATQYMKNNPISPILEDVSLSTASSFKPMERQFSQKSATNSDEKWRICPWGNCL